VYLANWTGTMIWLAPNLPVQTQDLYGISPSPASDVSPLTFFESVTSPAQNSFNCPVGSGDTLTITVANPQSGTQASLPPVTAH
jgi:hypothetical protein